MAQLGIGKPTVSCKHGQEGSIPSWASFLLTPYPFLVAEAYHKMSQSQIEYGKTHSVNRVVSSFVRTDLHMGCKLVAAD
jgi:hypothetical protein